MRLITLVAFIYSLLASSTFGAVQILNYNPDLHNRFDSSSFIGSLNDWSGVGRSSDNRWATMISASYFISANHFSPGISSSVTFFEDNSSTGVSVTRQVESGVRIGNTDIWVGKLDAALPSNFTFYDIPSTQIDVSSSLGVYADAQVFNVGLRGEQSTSGTTNFAVGFNNIELGDSTSELNGSFDAVGFVEDQAGDTNLHDPGETFFNVGDSGAPSFLLDGGNLTIVGLHSYTVSNLNEFSISFGDFVESQSPNSPYGSGGFQTRDASYDTFLPNYRDEILSAVPEPSSYGLLLGVFSLGWGVHLRTRRRRPLSTKSDFSWKLYPFKLPAYKKNGRSAAEMA